MRGDKGKGIFTRKHEDKTSLTIAFKFRIDSLNMEIFRIDWFPGEKEMEEKGSKTDLPPQVKKQEGEDYKSGRGAGFASRSPLPKKGGVSNVLKNTSLPSIHLTTVLH